MRIRDHLSVIVLALIVMVCLLKIYWLEKQMDRLVDVVAAMADREAGK